MSGENIQANHPNDSDLETKHASTPCPATCTDCTLLRCDTGSLGASCYRCIPNPTGVSHGLSNILEEEKDCTMAKLCEIKCPLTRYSPRGDLATLCESRCIPSACLSKYEQLLMDLKCEAPRRKEMNICKSLASSCPPSPLLRCGMPRSCCDTLAESPVSRSICLTSLNCSPRCMTEPACCPQPSPCRPKSLTCCSYPPPCEPNPGKCFPVCKSPPCLPPSCLPQSSPQCLPQCAPQCSPQCQPICPPQCQPICQPQWFGPCLPQCPPQCSPCVPQCQPACPPLCPPPSLPKYPSSCSPLCPPACQPQFPPACPPQCPPACPPACAPPCAPQYPSTCPPQWFGPSYLPFTPSQLCCPEMECSRPQGCQEFYSGSATWEAFGVRIKWTDPSAPTNWCVWRDCPISVKMCVEVKPSAGLDPDLITANCWTNMTTMCNPCGSWKNIVMLYQSDSSSVGECGNCRYVYSMTLTPNIDDTNKLTFNINFHNTIIWASNTLDNCF